MIGSLEYAVAARLDVHRLMGWLPYRDQELLRLRFGIDGFGEHSLREIGEEFGVSVERTRQIEAKAIRRLRSMVRTGRPPALPLPALPRQQSAHVTAFNREVRNRINLENAERRAREAAARQKAAEEKIKRAERDYWAGVNENIELIVADGQMTREQARAWVLR